MTLPKTLMQHTRAGPQRVVSTRIASSRVVSSRPDSAPVKVIFSPARFRASRKARSLVALMSRLP
jgi:hypothetical protein